MVFFVANLDILIASDLPVMEVHLVVLTDNGESRQITESDLREEVDILNHYFVDEYRNRIIDFRYKSSALYSEIEHSSCVWVKVGESRRKMSHLELKSLFNICRDVKVRDPKAINIYIYDAYSPEHEFADQDSKGFNNSSKPFVLLDRERLGHKLQSPEEHEMGHAFGLQHICEPNSTYETTTNIMATPGAYPGGRNCSGSGGLRNNGFTQEQERIILENASKILDCWRGDNL